MKKEIGIILIASGLLCMISGIYIIANDTAKQQKVEQNIQKGEAFLQYVIDKFDFSRKSLTLEYKSETNSKRKSCADLLVRLDTKTDVYRMAVECAWRSKFPENGLLEWTSQTKLQSMIDDASASYAPLFLVLGIGGTPDLPKDLYAIPIGDSSMNCVRADQSIAYKCNAKGGKFYYDGKTRSLTIK